MLAWSNAARSQVAAPAPQSLNIGDWQLTPVVEARIRGEYRNGLDVTGSGLLDERTRLGFDVERDLFEARVVLQDARSLDLGGGSHVTATPGPLAVTGAYEVWGEVHSASSRPSYIRVGRQPITWGEGRLLGLADWSPTGRSLDAVRGRLALGDSAFELLAVALSDPSIATVAAYGELFGARAEVAFDPRLGLEAYLLARLAQANPAASLDGTVNGQTYTGALRAHGDDHGWNWGVEGAYQLGRVYDLAENRNAWAAAGHISYTFEIQPLRPRVQLATAYASGDSGGPTYRGFDPLLPDVHVWHGAMDLFGWSNEAEASARLEIVPWAEATAALEYRYARLAQPSGSWVSAYLATVGRDPLNTKGELGHEIDSTFGWSPWETLSMSAGYSLLVLGAGARDVISTAQVGLPGLVHFAYAQAEFRVP